MVSCLDTRMRDKNQDRSASPMSEEEIQAATVGERLPDNASIHLSEYNPSWTRRFSEIESQIHAALGSSALLIEHVGSTSVPGLAAKPIIDVLVAVHDSRAEESYVPRLESCGFVLRIREPNWYEHRLFKTPESDSNIHVFSNGCKEIERLLTFRDWLRENESDRNLYLRTKKKLAAQVWKYTQNYADAKTDVVEEILVRASATNDG